MTGVGLGISGTREGCNSAQWTELRDIMEQMLYTSNGVFYHGDCVGVDEEAHRIARQLGYFIEVFPPVNPRFRAWCDGDVIHEPQDYKVRDRLIVDRAAHMLIVPEKAEADAPRSGTWYTFRYAKEQKVPTTLIVGGRFDHRPARPGLLHEPPEQDDAVRLPPLKVQSWRELETPGGPEVPPDGVH